jgi:deazaflavin-dependent oxidoreductase (nitroreductase family)
VKPVAFDWGRMKNIQKIHRLLYAVGLGPVIGRIILLLTTKGRRSGSKRVTPLQYERIGNDYYVGAARGMKADWVRNLQCDPHVEVRVGRRFLCQGRVVNDPSRFADFWKCGLHVTRA